MKQKSPFTIGSKWKCIDVTCIIISKVPGLITCKEEDGPQKDDIFDVTPFELAKYWQKVPELNG